MPCWSSKPAWRRSSPLLTPRWVPARCFPGRGPGHEVNLADDQVIDEFEKLLDAGGSSASLSGEEYRRRLFGAFNMEPSDEGRRPEPSVRIGQRLREPGRARQRLRLLHQDRHQPQALVPLRPDAPTTGRISVAARTVLPIVSSDTLISLRVGDPENATAERWLPEDVYDKAFDAWEVARDSVYTAWKELTDPNAFQPDLPLSFRDAYALVIREGQLPRQGRADRARQPAAQRSHRPRSRARCAEPSTRGAPTRSASGW